MKPKSHKRIAARMLGICFGACVLIALAGCAHVKPYQRQHLADRIMDPASVRWEAASERKMLSTREGAMGGVQGMGGGCACN
jgi:hypothetical protein